MIIIIKRRLMVMCYHSCKTAITPVITIVCKRVGVYLYRVPAYCAFFKVIIVIVIRLIIMVTVYINIKIPATALITYGDSYCSTLSLENPVIICSVTGITLSAPISYLIIISEPAVSIAEPKV